MPSFEKEKIPEFERKEPSFAEVLKDYQFSIYDTEDKEIVISFSQEDLQELKEHPIG